MKNTGTYKPIVLSIQTDSIREAVEEAITAAGLKFVRTNPVDLIKFDLTDTIAFLETGSDIAHSVMTVHEHYRYNDLKDGGTNIFVITTDEIFEKNEHLGMWHIADRAAVNAVLFTKYLNEYMPSILKAHKEGRWIGRFEQHNINSI